MPSKNFANELPLKRLGAILFAMPDTVQLDANLVAARVALDDIPVIDLAPFRHGDAAARRAVAKQIGDAARRIGFFYIVNHGVPDALVADVYAEAKRFFDLPTARKAEIAIEKSSCHRGWFMVGGENLDPAKQKKAGDLKEGIKIGRDLGGDHPLVQAGTPLHGPNQWPAGLPGWRETMQNYYDAMERLGRDMLHGFALALDIPETYFDSWLNAPMTTLGPLHYPPQQGHITEAQLGAGAHTDYGCLTMLAQDDSGGLQVRDRAGNWIDAPPVPGSFVVNIGDMMERWTNGVFTSTLHRVINTSGRERYSLPYFFDPDFAAPVICLESCQGDGPKFPPTTAGQHLLDMINASFSYHKGK
jgi:isopenicillin N synthase-like dioxygenase